jgi:hypothetical protein
MNTYQIRAELHDSTLEDKVAASYSNKREAIRFARDLAKSDNDLGVSRWCVELNDHTVASFRTKFDRLSHIR